MLVGGMLADQRRDSILRIILDVAMRIGGSKEKIDRIYPLPFETGRRKGKKITEEEKAQMEEVFRKRDLRRAQRAKEKNNGQNPHR